MRESNEWDPYSCHACGFVWAFMVIALTWHIVEVDQWNGRILSPLFSKWVEFVPIQAFQILFLYQLI